MRSDIGQVSKFRRFKSFLKNDAGSITQMLGLSALPLFAALGAAVDTVRINREQTAFHAAVDSAVLAIAADDRAAIGGQTTAQQAASITLLQNLGKEFINASYKPSAGTSNDITVSLAITNQAITITATHSVPTAIMGLFGAGSSTLTTTSEVKKAMRPVELTLVMDTTGSMASNNKITGAKTAAKSLLTTLYGGSLAQAPQSEFIRVSLVPFAAAVRLDKTAYDFDLGWIDTTGANPISKLNFNDSSWNNYMAWSQLKPGGVTGVWNGCVEARSLTALTGGLTQDDTTPDPMVPATLFPAYFAPDTPTNSSGQTLKYGSDYVTGYYNGSGPYTASGENLTLSAGQASTFTDAGRLIVQKNQAKYINKTIGVENLTNYGPWDGCAASKVVPMTYDRTKLEAGIDAMTADGPTLIAEGLAWGWRSISPNEPFTKVEGTATIAAATISPYDDVRWRKVMVLMTDGDNDLGAGNYGFNGTIYSSYGRGRENLPDNRFGTTVDSNIMTALDNGMLNVCTSIKSKNIELYVTSFGTGVSATTKSRLQSCATKPANYANSTTATDLQVFFDHIGQDVINKSVYVSK